MCILLCKASAASVKETVISKKIAMFTFFSGENIFECDILGSYHSYIIKHIHCRCLLFEIRSAVVYMTSTRLS